MKNAMLALMLCLGTTACLDDRSAPTGDHSATPSEDTVSQSQAELQITGHELDPTGPKATTCFPAQPCPEEGVHQCNFECCDGATGVTRGTCVLCLGHANDFCQTFGHGNARLVWVAMAPEE